MTKRELLHMDRAVFEDRARLKQMKLRLGIKGEDEDLVNQKVSCNMAQAPPLKVTLFC
jgi:enhancer of polycomb-like protein